MPEEDLSLDTTELDTSVSTAISLQELEEKVSKHVAGTSLSAQFVMLTKQAAKKSKLAKEEGRKRISPRTPNKINRDLGAWDTSSCKNKSNNDINDKTSKKKK